MVDQRVSAILLTAGLFCLASVIMSLYSISTADWSNNGFYSVGLFQTCFTSNSHCMKNQYGTSNLEMNSSTLYSKRLFNAAPLSIVGVFVQLIVCVLCFTTAFIYLPPRPSITCYILPLVIFIAFLFQFLTITEASYGIHLNGRSSGVFETALVFQILILILSLFAADRIHAISDVQYV